MIEERRRILNYSIKREMQLRLLFKAMMIVFIAVTVTAFFFYHYSNQEIGGSFRQFHISGRTFLDFLLPAIVMAVVVGSVSALAMAIFFPQRIAGPLYRIERGVKEDVASGDLTVRFFVRKGDECEDLAEALNTMVDKLKDRLQKIEKATEELSRISTTGINDVTLRRLPDIAKTFEDAIKDFKM